MTRWMFLLTEENAQAFSSMFGERSFLNLFRDNRTPLDSVRDKLVTLIYFVKVQCQIVRTTWYSASLLFQILQQVIIVKTRRYD